jgi:hypothetical protein
LNFGAISGGSRYWIEFRVLIDGSDVFTPNSVEVKGGSFPHHAPVIGGYGNVPPLSFKESLVIEKKVSERSLSSVDNKYRVYGQLYIPA